MIATRTKAALAAAQARGVKLGGPKLPQARKKAVASIKAIADQQAGNVLPIIREIQRSGSKSLRQIADALMIAAERSTRLNISIAGKNSRPDYG